MILRSATIFALVGLIGPLVRWATWPPSPTSAGSFGNFLYDLVLLLWLTQPLAVLEASMSPLAAVAVSVAANVLLFAAVGMLAGALARSAIQLSSVYLAVCVIVVLIGVWSVGSSFSWLNISALVVALVFMPSHLVWCGDSPQIVNRID